MAISTAVYRNKMDELERHYKDLYNTARGHGDYRTADSIYAAYMTKRKELEMQDLYGTANQIGSTLLGLNNAVGIADQSAYQQALMNQQLYGLGITNQAGLSAPNIAKQDFKPEFGVLYMNGTELPADWSGAKITSYKRTVGDARWVVLFESKWDKSLEIRLYLDMEELNGKEVNETANTYMEALNQRRAG